ncbi:protein artichoke-like [Penaeus monodon]|uniref:protein artichoke-like n=1 Tax=Penaeus monodon TaxID=6687 RepID=UPI0018A7B369|nr:protein artichoke-like [Penaeus monodon]
MVTLRMTSGGMLATVAVALAALLPLAASQEVLMCPKWEENPWCPCYNNDYGIFMECPMVSLDMVSKVLGLVSSPIHSLSIYDLDPNVTTLPSEVFSQSSGVSQLQISHSNLQSLADGSFEGLEGSLEKLTIKHCKLNAIPQSPLFQLGHLTNLDFENNNITEIPSFAFSKLTLVSLNLKDNRINLVSDYAFDGLKETLEVINFNGNNLSQLPLSSLRKLSSLKKLHVAWNHIPDVHLDEHNGLPTLEYLDMSSNRIRKIKSTSLSGLPELVSLSLYMNSINSVARDAFRANPLLETLFFSHNNIRHLARETFKYTPKIRIIDLGNNNLQSILGGLFCNLPELEELVLANNNIREIADKTFANSTKIKVLNLEHNAIRFIELETFREMIGLETLLLSHNNVQELYPRLFMSNINLQTLKLDNNNIHHIDESLFKNTARMTKLFLENNRITKIERGLFSLNSYLQELHLDNNDIEVIAAGAFSKLRKLEHLSLQDNEILALPDALPDKTSSLRYLRLSGNNLNTLNDHSLKGQDQLDVLWLDRNNISALVEGVFKDSALLRQLHLQENQISYIQEQVFMNMTELLKLYLSYNLLETINERMLFGLSALNELHLDNNMIREIAPNSFHNMSNLEKLNLSGNMLTSIEKSLFKTELRITHLIIDNAQVSEIEDGAFDALTYLDTLSLRGNDLYELNGGYLKLSQLRNLDLSNNNFQAVGSSALIDLPFLETLDLSECSIEAVPRNFFNNSKTLRSLSLRGNNLTHLEPLVFRSLFDLRRLDISYNALDGQSCRSLLPIKELEQLSISGNPIKHLCPSLGLLHEMKELYASDIQMTDLKVATMESLRHIEVLDISDNHLTHLPIGSLQDSSLRRLNLAGNKLKQIPDTLFVDGVSSLELLNISNNPLDRLVNKQVGKRLVLDFLEELVATGTKLKELASHELLHMPSLRSLNLANGTISKIAQGTFRTLNQLSQLNLGFNLLQTMPRERLRGLPALTHLNLTRNRLKQLDQFPSDSGNMKVLDVSGNMLTEIEEHVFRHTESLEKIYLGDNWITSIHPRSLEHLDRVRHLDLNHNNLEVLQPFVLHPIERTLETIKLTGNPLVCNCDTLDLWIWLQNHPGQVESPHLIVCEMPETLRGHSFLTLSASVFCPQPLILNMDIQDTQSQALLVSWQAANTSAVYGFRVSYKAIGEDNTPQDVITSPTLGLGSREYLLEDLEPSTEYQVCVHGMAKSLGLVHPHTVGPTAESLRDNDEGSRCIRGRTMWPASAIVAVERVGTVLGALIATAVLVGIFVMFVRYRVCRRAGEKGTVGHGVKPNGAPPDYYSHHHHFPKVHRDDEFAC